MIPSVTLMFSASGLTWGMVADNGPVLGLFTSVTTFSPSSHAEHILGDVTQTSRHLPVTRTPPIGGAYFGGVCTGNKLAEVAELSPLSAN